MQLEVKKFGGSSLANIDRIRHVAKIIASTHARGMPQIVVVSAMFGSTDKLIAMGDALGRPNNPREYAALVSTGEQVSMSLLCMALDELGIDAQSFNGSQAGIHTDNNFKAANIISIDCQHLLACLAIGKIAIVAGFQGINVDGEVTTLGRGGSDTTAVALAAATKAQSCEIYTDVDGIFTADPKVVHTAAKIDTIDMHEMLMLAHYGARVTHPRAIEIAKKYNMSINVLSSFNPQGGTLIKQLDNPIEQPIIRAICSMHGIARLCFLISAADSNEASAFNHFLCENCTSIEMYQANMQSKSILRADIVLSQKDICTLKAAVINTYGNRVSVCEENNQLSMVSVIGLGLCNHQAMYIAGDILKILNKKSINLLSIVTGDARISLVLPTEYEKNAVKALHEGLVIVKNQ